MRAKPPNPEQQPATLDECRRCDLWRDATQPVGGQGARRAKLMLVVEQPGDQDDLAGKPVAGPAGGLLDDALEAAGIDRREVYVTNAVKHFKWEPRGKRRMHKTPAQREVEACHYWLEGELAQVQPRVIVVLGSTALKSVTGDPDATLKAVLGQPFLHEGRWIIAIYHPSYVLRVPDERMKAQGYRVMVDGFRQALELSSQPVPRSSR
jgi:DNA polymerase